MDPLIVFGRLMAPLALEATVTISLAALAALLAARLLGQRPARAFGYIAAALGLAMLLVLSRSPAPAGDDPPSLPAVWEEPAPAAAPPDREPAAAPAMTSTPGLSGRYGSLFQVLIARFPAASSDPPGPAGCPWAAGFGLVWLAGFLALVLGRLLAILGTCRLLGRTRACADPRLLRAAESVRLLLDGRRVELRLLPGARTALVAGLLRPRIILPADAVHWPLERLTATLLHEHAHAQRLDVPVAEGLRLAAALAWWSPLPWRALALALRLREEACDAVVVRGGIPGTVYAAGLLDAARSLARAASPAAAASLAAGHLERRIRAVLDRSAAHPWWDGPLRTGAAAGLVAASLGLARIAAPLYGIPELPPRDNLPRGAGEWLAGAEPRAGASAARGAFALAFLDGYARIRLRYRGHTHLLQVPAIALPARLPLTGRARMIVPFGDLVDGQSGQAFFNPGWSIWDGRQAQVLAAASGRVAVARIDPANGPIIEILHGGGLRTRYGLGRDGRSRVQAGEFVAAGTELGQPGAGSALDLPVLQFSVLAQVGEERIALDPAPFLLGPAENRRTPLGASAVNAAVRLEDPAQLARLLAWGVVPDHAAADGTLPLEWALMAGNLPIIRELLDAGADPRVPTWNVHQAAIARHGPTILELARTSGDPALAALFPGIGAGQPH